MLSDESRTACADPYFAIGYAKETLRTTLFYLSLENTDGMRESLRTAYEALDSVKHVNARTARPTGKENS